MPLNGESGEHQARRGPGGRQAGRLATEEGIHLEGREDRHVPTEGDPVIVSEIQFGPAREKEVRQTAGIQGEPRSHPRDILSQASQPPAPVPVGFSKHLLGGP